jgi:hypothetical protein
MSIDGQRSQSLPTATESTARARTISASVGMRERKPWAEITCALVLALATTASAWCAYQSNRWSGVQTFRLAEANEAGRQAAKSSVAGMQIRAFDGTMFLQYLEAHAQGQKQLKKLLFDRFRPEMKVAMEAWLGTDPFNKQNAPLHPLRMAEYKLSEETESSRQASLQQERMNGAQEANTTSDTYVLLTVMFASVLFFGGIAGTVHLAWLRRFLAALAITFFAGTVLYLVTMPICRE